MNNPCRLAALAPLALLATPLSASAATPDEARLRECLDLARNDPATAVTVADTWLSEATGAASSYPQQCLGQTYVSLLRWDAATQAFEAARNARPESDGSGRARLAAMAGNAQLAANDPAGALENFDTALADAGTADERLSASFATDRSVALVQLGRLDEAATALEQARTLDAQSARTWLLSATLSRRLQDYEAAAAQIQTAQILAPEDLDIALEAGVIAVLAGDEAVARRQFERVRSAASDSEQAAAAQFYLDQLDRTSG